MSLARLLTRRSVLPESDILEFPDSRLIYRIRASARRRRLQLEWRADGSLTVAVPHTTSLATIRDFIRAQYAWIESQRARQTVPVRAPMRFENGARLGLLGNELTLEIRVAPGRRTECQGDSQTLRLVVAHEQAIPMAIEAWYRRQAATHATARHAHFAPQVGCSAGKLVIRAQRSRWGSCSARGTISLNWRLLQAPEALFDYVLVHELCHLRHPDHSPRFWAEVARVIPDWRQRRAALREFGRSLRW